MLTGYLYHLSLKMTIISFYTNSFYNIKCPHNSFINLLFNKLSTQEFRQMFKPVGIHFPIERFNLIHVNFTLKSIAVIFSSAIKQIFKS